MTYICTHGRSTPISVNTWSYYPRLPVRNNDSYLSVPSSNSPATSGFVRISLFKWRAWIFTSIGNSRRSWVLTVTMEMLFNLHGWSHQSYLSATCQGAVITATNSQHPPKTWKTPAAPKKFNNSRARASRPARNTGKITQKNLQSWTEVCEQGLNLSLWFF